MSRPFLITNQKTLVAIKKYIRKNKIPSTIKELCEILKIKSTRTGLRCLQRLEKKKIIRRWHGARGISVIEFEK